MRGRSGVTTQASKEDLLNQFREWTSYVREIEPLDWTKPIGEGKWSVQGLVSHAGGAWKRWSIRNGFTCLTVSC